MNHSGSPRTLGRSLHTLSCAGVKMFRKICFTLLAGLSVVTGIYSPLLAQSSITSSTDFDIVQPRAGDQRLRVLTDPYIKWDNRSGTILSALSVFTTVDSLDSYAENRDLQWVIVVEGTYTPDSLVYLRRQEFDFRSGRLIRTDRDTADFSAGTGKYAGAAHLDSLTFGRTPMISLKLSTWAVLSQPVAKTYATHLYLLHEKMVPGSVNGSIATYALPDRLDSLTIADFDTLEIADTTFTAAIPGNFGYVTLFLRDGATNSDSLFRGFLGYQVKYDGGSWSGPLDTLLYAFPVLDSLTADSGSTRAYWTSTTPADSLRFTVRNISNLGRSIVHSIKALWRD